MAKQVKNELPAEVAEKYTCSIEPCVIVINKPVEVAGTWDLTMLTLEQAEKLAKANKYLEAKPKGPEKK